MLNKQALLSVIIPVHNTERYLSACVEKLSSQTYINLEIICVNDGSTDGSLSILQNAQKRDSRIKIINSKNLGSSLARFEGFKLSRGEYVTFLDSDDYIEQNCYEIAMKAIVNSNADICEFNYERSGIAVGKWKKCTIEKENIFLNYFEGKIHNKLWNKVYRREVFTNVDFPEHRDIREDASIMAQVLQNCSRIINISDVLYHYRITPKSLTNKRHLSNLEVAGSYRNDFDKINILWKKLPNRRNEISRQLFDLIERIILGHRNFSYFKLYDLIYLFVAENYNELISTINSSCCEYRLLTLIHDNRDLKEVYNQYVLYCFSKFDTYRIARIFKYYITSLRYT